MRKMAALLVALTLLFGTSAPAGAVSTSASSAVLMDAGSGRVLFEEDMHTPRPIASITKLMTALVAVEETSELSQVITVEPEWLEGVEGSSLYLKAGDQLTLETLLYGLLLQSGNDAAQVIACWIGEDLEGFAQLMNEKARELGMSNTHFTNPSGLNQEEHYSSAYDMALLACACLENPTVANICATQNISLEGRTFVNHNKLLWLEEDCVGMKTGYTEASGRTLVSAATRGAQTLVCVTLNDPDDWDDHQALLHYGFDTYPVTQLCGEGTTVGQAAVAGSVQPTVSLVAQGDCWYPLAEGEQLDMQLDVYSPLTAPIPAGTQVGTARWILDGEVVAEMPVETGTGVEDDRWKPNALVRWWMGLWGKSWETTVPGMGLI